MKEKILKLQKKIADGKISSSSPWQGGDVVILDKAPEPSVGNFYPDPRFVETKFVGELSWVFEQLRNIFWKNDGYGAWKEEFFGRLGNVATKFQSVCPECSIGVLLEAVVEEAAVMAEEIVAYGGLQYLALTFDNRILDDFVLVSDNNRYLSQELVARRLQMYVNEDLDPDQACDEDES